MPRYELMYLLGAQVSDDQVPQVTQDILKTIESLGAQDLQENQLGKKKLAYPIGKTRNGYYVVANFTMDSQKVKELEGKLHALDNTIIRYLIINLEEYLSRQAKDAIVQSKIVRRQPPVEKPAEEKAPAKVLDLNPEELEKKIEEALTEDLTK